LTEQADKYKQGSLTTELSAKLIYNSVFSQTNANLMGPTGYVQDANDAKIMLLF
jgi:hypothetical protein